MAALARSPGQPAVLEGFLNLRGVVVPVLRMDRLFDLPPFEPGLNTPLIILRGEPCPAAVMAEAVVEIASPPADDYSPVGGNSSFNDCCQAQVRAGGRNLNLLLPQRLLLEKERRSVAEFQARSQHILDRLEGPAA